MRKLLSNSNFLSKRNWERNPLALTKGAIFILLLTLPAFLNAEGSQDAGPLPGDLVMLFTNNTTFGDFAAPGTAPTSRLYITFCNPGEKLYIKLSREYDGFGVPQFSGDYDFQIRNSVGTIVHGPFTVNSVNENATSIGDATFTGSGDPAYAGIFTFTPPAVGDYYIEFIDPDQAIIGFWDFTVADVDGIAKTGRLWSQNWALRTPQIADTLPECEWDRPFNATIYSYTSDGFVSKIDFENSGFQGLSFNINFTSTGPGNSGDPFMDRKSMVGNFTTNAEHKIFFNPPDMCAFPDGECGAIDFDMEFDCDANGDFCLPVSVSQPGQVDILLDFNNNQVFDPNTEDVVIIYCFTPGNLSECIPWDGMKGDGSMVALGDNFNVVITYAQGVQHWAVFDGEFLKNGFCVEVVRPICAGLSTNKLYWDDELIPDLPGTGQPKQQFAGCECQTNGCRTWNYFDPNDDDCISVNDAQTLGYGDKNTLNTWWFARISAAQPVSIPFLVCDITGPAFLCDGGDAQLIADFTVNTNVTNIDWSGPGGFSSMGDETNTMVTVSIAGTYTVMITDVNGCTTSCSYELLSQICCPCTQPPTIICPDDVVFDCNPADANNDGIPDAIPDPNQEIADGAVIASNPDMNCMVTITHGGDSQPVQNGCVYTLTRTYIATNECEDLFETCTQTFTWIEDDTPPSITCPGPVSVDCVENVPAPDINLVNASDACPGNVTVTHVGDVSDNMNCPQTITRTYRATDACGNTADCTQIITVNDNTPPTITCPGPITVDCVENVPAPDVNLPVTSDNCAAGVTVTHVGDVSDGNTCPQTITRTYRATDACGNTAECTQIITVDDNTPPTITCPGPIAVDCIENVPAPDVNLPVTSDNCAAGITVTHVSDVSDNMTCPQTITRTYRATDACGNTAECTQIITVDDNTPPSITCPGPITVDCVENIPAPDVNLPVTSDNCAAGVTVTHVSDVSDNMTCPQTITRTYRATDACGNTAECTQIITVDDNTPPTITCPGPIAVDCIENVPAPDVNLPVTSDNCAAGVTVTHVGDVSDGNTCPRTITRTYRATDACGNTAECTQIITVDDNTPPSITCPDPITVDCVENIPAPDVNLPVTSDNCAAGVTVTHVGDVSDGNTCPRTITRTYRATDACGNTAECTQIITVDDNTPPTITCPGPIAVDCIENVPAPDVNLPVTSDNCAAGVTVTHVGDVSDGNTCPRTITRTYRATDACGNTAECTQIITVDDNTPPSITCPGPIAVDCIENVPAPDVNLPVTSDNCAAGVTVTHVGDVSDGNTCPRTITRTYRATDACGNTAECTQIITVNDNTPPSITCPDPIMVECIEDVPAPNTNLPIVSDNCNGQVTVTHIEDITDNMTCPQVILRVYRATDACGNINECIQLISIEDNTAPTITCPNPVTVDCIENIPAPDVNLPVTSDNCAAPVTVTHVGDVSDNMTCPRTITRTYRATDACGNTAECTQLITIDDNIPPTIVCPPMISVDCIENVPAPDETLPTVMDNCNAPVTVSHVTDNHYMNCPLWIVRIYRATDACGNMAECMQIILVNDNIPPSITCPGPIFVDCVEDVPAPNVNLPSVSDNCVAPVTVTHVSDVSDNMTCPQTITRTYRATDACGNTAECTQLIVVGDNTPPIITCPGPITVDCIEDVPAPNTNAVTASDNCNAPVVITHVSDVYSNSTCPRILTRTYRARDICGNTAECTQIITIDDNTPPVINCPPPIMVDCIENVPAPNIGLPNAFDNCNAPVTVTHVSDVSDNMTCPQTITRTYRATDACGNTATCTQLIFIDDNTPPSITCPGTIMVDCVANVPAPNTALVSTSDNCAAPVSVIWVSDVSDGNTCPERITRTYRAIDACGNTRDCTQLIIVDDNTPPSITCPGPIMVDCIGNIPPPNTGLVTTSDNCAGTVTVQWIGDTMNGQSCPVQVTRRYRATDACGNFRVCTQLITVIDNTLPMVNCPASPPVISGCSAADVLQESALPYSPNPMLISLGQFQAEGGVASDNCGIASIRYQDTASGLCPINVTRTFTIVDDCGNSVSCQQHFVIQDDARPNWGSNLPDVTLKTSMGATCPNPASISLVRDRDIPIAFGTTVVPYTVHGSTFFTPNANVSDNCTPAQDLRIYVWNVQNNFGGTANGCMRSIRVVFRMFDNCDNFRSQDVIYNIIDDTAPEITTPAQDTTFACDGLGNIQDLNDWLASNGGAIAMDDCQAVTWSNNYSGLTTGVCGAAGSVTVTFTASDGCGNSASTMATFSIIDDTPPEGTCPDGLANLIDPGDVPAPDPDAVEAGYTDDCGDVHVSFLEAIDEDSPCFEFVIIHAYLVEDDCGNSFICEVVHTGLPLETEPLVGTCLQGTFNNECIGKIEAPDPAEVAANYTGEGEVSAVIIDTLITGDDCEGFMLTFVYEVFDDCKSVICEVTFHGQDFKAPRGDCPVGMTGLACIADIPELDLEEVAAGFNDPCGEVFVTLQETIDDTDNCWFFSRTYVYAISDICGNTRICEVTYSGATQMPSTSINVALDLTCIDQVPEPDPDWMASNFDNGCGDELTGHFWNSIVSNNFCNGFRVVHYYMIMQECGGMFWAAAVYMGTNCPGCEGGGSGNLGNTERLSHSENDTKPIPSFLDWEDEPSIGADLDMEVYPNPTNGKVNVLLKGFESDDVQLTVLDINGIAVYTKAADHPKGETTILDLKHLGLPSGVYYLMAVSDQQLKIKKVVLSE